MSLAKHFIQRSKSNEVQVTRVSWLNLEGKIVSFFTFTFDLLAVYYFHFYGERSSYDECV